MAALLVGLSVMGVMMSMALPVWQTAVKREREAELVFRGEQYAQAIELYSRRNGGFPPNLDVLEEGRYIRRLYRDPMTPDGEFLPIYFGQPMPGQTGELPEGERGGAPGLPLPGASGPAGRGGLPAGAGPIIGVVSASTDESLRLYNGRGRYSEWAFVAVAATAQAGAPGGAQNPGVPGDVGGAPGVVGPRGRGVGPGTAPPGGRGLPGGVAPGPGPGQAPAGRGGRGGFPFPGL